MVDAAAGGAKWAETEDATWVSGTGAYKRRRFHVCHQQKWADGISATAPFGLVCSGL
jgi:hypothetical protein